MKLTQCLNCKLLVASYGLLLEKIQVFMCVSECKVTEELSVQYECKWSGNIKSVQNWVKKQLSVKVTYSSSTAWLVDSKCSEDDRKVFFPFPVVRLAGVLDTVLLQTSPIKDLDSANVTTSEDTISTFRCILQNKSKQKTVTNKKYG